MSQYTSYYLYQKYEKRGEQDWIPVYPNTYSIDGDGTMPLSAKTENDPACGYVPPTPPSSSTYLTFVALEDGTFTFNGTSVNYSLDSGSTWNVLATSAASPTVTAGKKIMWKGELTPTYYDGIGRFTSTGQFDIEGNIMSLLYGDNFEDKTSLSGKTSAFRAIFARTNVVNAENLVLPATTLADRCYMEMFNRCTSLVSIPNLPATTLAGDCYWGMFKGCTSLTTAPELPATTLADRCYYDMFYECSGLTSLPQNMLPATSLANECYGEMFYGCTSLLTVPSNLLPATTLADKCYFHMFYGCASLTTVPSLPATTLADWCYYSMFYGCTSLTSVPSNLLPATTLAHGCYAYMFSRCTSLTTAPDLLATTLVTNCYWCMFDVATNLNYIKCLATNPSRSYNASWVGDVASSGTFIKASSVSSWATGKDGIPSGWTVQNA